MTNWWNTVAKGTAIGVNGAAIRAPSVADHFGIRTDEKSARSSVKKNSLRSPQTFEMGDGVEVH